MSALYSLLEPRSSKFNHWSLFFFICGSVFVIWMTQCSLTSSESESHLNSTTSKPPSSNTSPKLDSSLPECTDDNSVVSTNTSVTFSTFKNCMLTHMKSVKENFEEGSRKCESLLDSEDVNVQEFRNTASLAKWAVLPKCKEPHHLLALGIEKDSSAEKELTKLLPDVVLHLSDPISEPNQQLLPFAVGKKSGTDKLRVMNADKKEEYRDATIIEMVYFIKEVLNLKRIDFFWINTKGSEYQLFDYFYKDGGLDKGSITVCQMNLDVHPAFVENGAALFQSFMTKLAEDEKFLLMKGRTDNGVHRMFLLNVMDAKCVNKYVL